jgi:hypothetical protein
MSGLGPMRGGSGRIEVDVRVPVGLSTPELAEFVRRCEGAGVGGFGVHDHHHGGRATYVALAYAAFRIQRSSSTRPPLTQ